MREQECFYVPNCHEGRCELLLQCNPGGPATSKQDEITPEDRKKFMEIPFPEIPWRVPRIKKFVESKKRKPDVDDRKRATVELSSSIEEQGQRRLGENEVNIHLSPLPEDAIISDPMNDKHPKEWYESRQWDPDSNLEYISFRDQLKPYLSEVAENPFNLFTTVPEFTTYKGDSQPVSAIKKSANVLGKVAGPIALGLTITDYALHAYDAYQQGYVKTLGDAIEVLEEYAGSVTYEMLQVAVALITAVSRNDPYGSAVTLVTNLDPRLLVTAPLDDALDIAGVQSHYGDTYSSQVIEQDMRIISDILDINTMDPTVQAVLSFEQPDLSTTDGWEDFVEDFSTQLDEVYEQSDSSDSEVDNLADSFIEAVIDAPQYIETFINNVEEVVDNSPIGDIIETVSNFPASYSTPIGAALDIIETVVPSTSPVIDVIQEVASDPIKAFTDWWGSLW